MSRSRWPITLAHADTQLRPLRYRDRRSWQALRARNEDWTREWDSTLPPGVDEQLLTYPAMVRQFNHRARSGLMLPWGVWYSAGTEPVLAGQLTVAGIAYGSAQWAQAGYWVDQRWAGRGVIPTALALAVDYCFSELKLHRFEVAIRPENVKSQRVVEKLAFRYEGRRGSYLHVAGQWRDHDVFVLNADEVPPGGVISRVSRPISG